MFFPLGQFLEFLIIFVKCEELIKSLKKKYFHKKYFWLVLPTLVLILSICVLVYLYIFTFKKWEDTGVLCF